MRERRVVQDALHDGGDDVVRLKTGLADDRDAKGGDRLKDARDLHLEVGRGRRPCGLVCRIDGVPEGIPGHVDDHRQVVGLRLEDQLEEGGKHPVHHLGRFAGHLTGHGRAHREECAEDLGVPVNQVEGLGGGWLPGEVRAHVHSNRGIVPAGVTG